MMRSVPPRVSMRARMLARMCVRRFLRAYKHRVRRPSQRSQPHRRSRRHERHPPHQRNQPARTRSPSRKRTTGTPGTTPLPRPRHAWNPRPWTRIGALWRTRRPIRAQNRLPAHGRTTGTHGTNSRPTRRPLPPPHRPWKRIGISRTQTKRGTRGMMRRRAQMMMRYRLPCPQAQSSR